MEKIDKLKGNQRRQRKLDKPRTVIQPKQSEGNRMNQRHKEKKKEKGAGARIKKKKGKKELQFGD